jgi:putative PIN family toxin of toxin-antitoxin system
VLCSIGLEGQTHVETTIFLLTLPARHQIVRAIPLILRFVYNGYMGVTTISKIVIDTSVLVSALRSRNGASFQLVSLLPHEGIQICLSVALYTEWQSVLTRSEHLPPGATVENALGFTRYLASIAHLQDVYFLWRPFLRDPDDDMVLECAVASGANTIVTHNIKDFARTPSLGVKALTPGQFLQHFKEKRP